MVVVIILYGDSFGAWTWSVQEGQSFLQKTFWSSCCKLWDYRQKICQLNKNWRTCIEKGVDVMFIWRFLLQNEFLTHVCNLHVVCRMKCFQIDLLSVDKATRIFESCLQRLLLARMLMHWWKKLRQVSFALSRSYVKSWFYNSYHMVLKII